MTTARCLVLAALADADAMGMNTYGHHLMRVCDLPSGTVYPMLAQFTADQLVTETVTAPTRRWYRLTPAGRAAAQTAREWVEFELALAQMRAQVLQDIAQRFPAPVEP
jgi:DNA-binding PadR family transcriptional regulator